MFFYTGKEGVTKILIENNANVNSRNIDRDTPLHLAADSSIIVHLVCYTSNVILSISSNQINIILLKFSFALELMLTVETLKGGRRFVEHTI